MAQKSELEVDSDHLEKRFRGASSKLSEKINENLFIAFKITDKKTSALVGYDANFNQKFSLPLQHGDNSHPMFKYNPETNKIFVMETYGFPGSLKHRNIIAKVYNIQGKLEKEKVIPVEIPMVEPIFSHTYLSGFSENGKYFYFLERKPLLGGVQKLTVYDLNLVQLYTKSIKVNADENIHDIAIGDDGGFVMVVPSSKNKVRFIKYDSKGKDNGQVVAQHKVTRQETFTNYKLKLVGDRVLVAAEKDFTKTELMAIHLYDVDFTTKTAKVYITKEFAPSYVTELYKNIIDDEVLNGGKFFTKKIDRPTSLKDREVTNILVEGDAIYLVTEALSIRKTTTHSSRGSRPGMDILMADDILVSAFENGENKWNSVIVRNFFLSNIPTWEPLKTIVHQNAKSINLLTPEFPREDATDISMYARTINKATGQVSKPARISPKAFYNYGNYACWLNPGTLVLFRTRDVKLLGKGFAFDRITLP